MRIHTQSPSKHVYNEKKDLLTVTDRRSHDAIEVGCPHCGVTAGHPCKGLLPRSVHMARQEAAL